MLLRGLNPYLVLLDEGIDILLDSGVKIQVKTSRKAKVVQRGYPMEFYHFNFKSWKTEQKEGIPRKLRRFQKSSNLENVDFIVCWCVNDDVFYIIPKDKIGGKMNINLNPGNEGKYEEFKEKWNILGG